MKFRLITWNEYHTNRLRKLAKWHRWFAWRPIRLSSDKNEIRWLEVIFRKAILYHSSKHWKYFDNEFDIIREDNDTDMDD